VPLFAAHHIECSQLGWAIRHPFGFCRNKYFSALRFCTNRVLTP
jgi:hypothetical protein